MKNWIMTICCMLLLVAVAGCVESVDPTGATTYNIDPNVVGQVEGGAGAAVGIMTVLSAFFPVLIPIIGIAGGILGTWYKVKPKLTEAQTEAAMYYSATEAIVTAIEDFKFDNPDDWEKLEAKLAKTIGPKAENVIRALRELPPKE